MTIEIRSVREDELPAYFEAGSTSFLDRPDVVAVAAEVAPNWDLSRTWAAFDDGRICGTYRSWATELTIPGGRQVPGAAVSGVAVMPTHRRRGILRAMVATEHAASRKRGEAVALLYAAEYPIYGRFGYGPACQVATWTIDTHGASFRNEPLGGIEMGKPDESAASLNRVYDTWRRRRVGEIRRRDYMWNYDLGLVESSWGPRWKGFVALHRDAAGEVDGYVRYRAEEKWEQRQPRQILKVDELHALSDNVYAGLWRFLAEIDWVATVKAESRSPSERLPYYLTNARAAFISDVGDGIWVRLLDIRRALEARTYEREASVVLEVIDPEATGGRSRVLLEAGPDGATCRDTDRSPDLTLGVGALGAAYLGGTRLRDAVVMTGVDEHSDGALERADALFRTADPPWCSTFF